MAFEGLLSLRPSYRVVGRGALGLHFSLDDGSRRPQGGAMAPTPLADPGPITNLGRLVQPADANEHGTLFGGEAMRFMDEAAAVAAIRYSRGPVRTAHVDAIDFHTPVPIGVFLEASARVIGVGRTSMTRSEEHTSELQSRQYL